MNERNEDHGSLEGITSMDVLEGILYYSFRDVEDREEKNFKMRDLQRSVYRLTKKEERLSEVFPFHEGTKYSEDLEQALSFLTMSHRVWRDRNVISGPSLNVGDSENFERIEEEVKEYLPQDLRTSIEEKVEECIESGEYKILS
ncbi:MAG: hypothetical protein ACLFTQ_04090 [Candidatus Aenigmatarchaeota archaeon]